MDKCVMVKGYKSGVRELSKGKINKDEPEMDTRCVRCWRRLADFTGLAAGRIPS